MPPPPSLGSGLGPHNVHQGRQDRISVVPEMASDAAGMGGRTDGDLPRGLRRREDGARVWDPAGGADAMTGGVPLS